MLVRGTVRVAVSQGMTKASWGDRSLALDTRHDVDEGAGGHGEHEDEGDLVQRQGARDRGTDERDQPEDPDRGELAAEVGARHSFIAQELLTGPVHHQAAELHHVRPIRYTKRT